LINLADVGDMNLIKDITYFKITNVKSEDYPKHIKCRIKERQLRKRASDGT